ncbi:hypothetical protein EJ06DRAFT_345205 [Trichodelitschia bisporula]|uniref:Zn(2)-C6 fungal-type domain-containing protein n=1 Tax=Trichodelitschia bisporula TaxID=703511 RepID=A0A6G1I2P0_9PEZI|nr:hypothetical protein EJ06DRAFT_345205 [Trichodelitschia bisporula]
MAATMAPTLTPAFGPPRPRSIYARQSSASSSSPSSSTSTAASSESPRTTFVFSIGLGQYGRKPSADAGSSSGEEVVPKVEEIEDDDVGLMTGPTKVESADGSGGGNEDIGIDGDQEIDDAGAADNSGENEDRKGDVAAVVRRPRGRPRKYPRSPPDASAKLAKGRSKTGCITCRRRKKKCDETKPACLHCQKNNVHCEGYPPKDYWQGGKQRLVKSRGASVDRPRELPLLIEGIETELDWFLFNHFNLNLSRVLSLFTDKQNPFKEILLPMATSHRGLMHSLLCLSGAHLSSRDPDKRFEERQSHHYDCAVKNLRTDALLDRNAKGDETAIIDDPTVAQTLVLCLRSICAGEVQGEYRVHLDAAKHLICTQNSRNQEFRAFLIEFFIYHNVSNSVTSIDRPSVLMMEDFQLPQFMIQPEAGVFLGVVDGLFGCISKIRQLRDRIRTRREQNLKPWVDYQILADAQMIDSNLRSWHSGQPVDTPRWTAAMLYRQCTWLYLHRTIQPSTPNAQLHMAVDEGLEYLRELPEDSSTQSIMLMPLFILGCSAFQQEQRPEIQRAFDSLEAYSSLGNIKYAKRIVERVWELMDEGSESSWDWETIIKDMGWDFLIT